MTELIEIKPETHRNLTIQSNAAMEAASSQHLLNLQVTEVPKAAMDFALFFSRTAQSREWSISAMMSFRPDSNLFVNNKQWQAIYQPAVLRTYPVFLMKSDNEKGYAYGIPNGHKALVQGGGNALYTANGSPTQYLNNVQKLLETSIEGAQQTQTFCARLAELDLFRPIDLILKFQDETAQTIQGLYCINEDRLQSLSQEQREELHQRGYWFPIHAMLMSMFQLNRLIRFYNQQSNTDRIEAIKIETAKKRNAA